MFYRGVYHTVQVKDGNKSKLAKKYEKNVLCFYNLLPSTFHTTWDEKYFLRTVQ